MENNLATEIVDVFESFLDERGIEIPCSNDKEKIERYFDNNTAKIYGTEYYTLVDKIQELLEQYKKSQT